MVQDCGTSHSGQYLLAMVVCSQTWYVHNHYHYWDVIDNDNSVRTHPISMEERWMTTHWPNHVFCFLLALTIVNVQNAGCYFAKLPKIDTLQA